MSDNEESFYMWVGFAGANIANAIASLIAGSGTFTATKFIFIAGVYAAIAALYYRKI